MMAEPFIQALVENGLLPKTTVAVTINARAGELVTMDYSIIAETEAMERVIQRLQVADSPNDATV
jgi:hypothetical protein